MKGKINQLLNIKAFDNNDFSLLIYNFFLTISNKRKVKMHIALNAFNNLNFDY